MTKQFMIHWFDPGTQAAGNRIVSSRLEAWKLAWRYIKAGIIMIRIEKWA